MAIRPDDAAVLAKGIREIFTESEAILLEKIAAALAKGMDRPDWAEQKLLNIQAVRRQIDQILEDLSENVPGAVERAVNLAYNRGIATAGGELTAAGLQHAAFAEVQPTGAVAAIISDTLARTEPMIFQIRRATSDIYQQVTTQTASQVASGVQTRQEASRALLTRLTKNGITGFRDTAGRQWEMGAYAEMAVRTASSQAMLQGHTDRVTELGIDTVIVSNAPEECEICRPMEGKVLSLSGRTEGKLTDGVSVYMSLREAKSKGLYHPNCRHSHSIYLPGITKPMKDTADPEGDKLREAQRGYERSIREIKRKVIVAKQIGGERDPVYLKEKAKLASLNSEFKAWREANDRKDLAYRTNLKAR
jgi:Phage minor capsid protein 2.